MSDPTVDVSASEEFAEHVSLVEDAARASLLFLEESGELSVALVDDDQMRELNANWRGKDQPTDVLAFAQREGDALGETELLGDVVVSIPTAQRQARERAHSVEDEIRELLVHGILHLLGYDHEISPEEADRMFARQREVLAALTAA